jgi:hypothetical protein
MRRFPPSLTTVGINSDHACDQCGAVAATIEESPSGGYALLCARCGVSHGELPPATIDFLADTVRVFGAPREPVIVTSAMRATEMKRDDLFPSKYLKASDLGGKPIVVEIATTGVEDLKDISGKTNSKLVVTFKGRKKSLVMNRTNYDAVADLHGEETNNWPGKLVELYPTKTSMGGKTMDCIRIRGTSAQDMDDAIPF